ncbi:MAG: GNAT family N-acetyltransferase [Lachnospiraceae bacterium]|nr:GNAT family N-acetyltransferase [Lachnospiraceae bacterium]
MKFIQITQKNIEDWREVIPPTVVKELNDWGENLAEGYFCIGAKEKKKNVGAIIAEHELGTGDLIILSLFIAPPERRKGYGTALLKKLCDLAYALCDWEKGEYGRDVFLKCFYSFSGSSMEVCEAFLEESGFTEFYLMEGEGGDSIRGATAQLHFSRPSEYYNPDLYED